MRTPDPQELADCEALRRLVTAYARAIDRRDFPLLRSLYHDDARDHHGAAFDGGIDGYIGHVRNALSAYEATVHYVLQTAFVIDGDHAEGEVHKINWHRTHGPDAEEVTTGSRSLDHYARRDGDWRFLSRRIVNDWTRRQPVDCTAVDPSQAPPGRAGAEDLSFQALTRFPPHSGSTP
jgi:hypothetical protein